MTGLCKSTILVKLQGRESEILSCCICIVTMPKGPTETQATGVYAHAHRTGSVLGQKTSKRKKAGEGGKRRIKRGGTSGSETPSAHG